MMSPLLPLWMKSSHPCQNQLSSETHKNIEQICLPWSMCVPAKQQYPEVLTQSFISLSNCTNKEMHSLLPVCIHSICFHGQNTFSSAKEQIKYACLSGHTATSEVTLMMEHFYLSRKQTEGLCDNSPPPSASPILFQHTGLSYAIRAGIILQQNVSTVDRSSALPFLQK